MAKRRQRERKEVPAGLPEETAAPAEEEAAREQAEKESSMPEEQKQPKAGSGEASEPGAKTIVPSTEQPVPAKPVPETSQYVVTVNNQTGLPVKVETLEPSGERKELTPSEYAALVASCTMPSAAGMSAAVYSAAVTPLIQGYFQGYADVVNALTSKK